MTFHEPHLGKLAVFLLFFFVLKFNVQSSIWIYYLTVKRVIFILFVTTLSKGSQRTAWYNSVNFQTQTNVFPVWCLYTRYPVATGGLYPPPRVVTLSHSAFPIFPIDWMHEGRLVFFFPPLLGTMCDSFRNTQTKRIWLDMLYRRL